MKRYEYHPYHIQRVQTLLSSDYATRVSFCRTMLEKHQEDPNFFDRILWSDESACKRDGYLNLHNIHSWQLENPHEIREDRSQHQFMVNLWTEIHNGCIIGPFELPATLNAEIYLDLLQNHLPILLEDVPLESRRRMWLQQDGCPAHYGRAVRAYLDETFANRLIGRQGPVFWPSRSPDLNPLVFLLGKTNSISR
ncbi:unnamed protein product [Callosobruchus maculatus]|uniref:Tc1-like transposase DDE domain-containing protein n=1 Tax=Callosobruchus maculatus TaxID=64391 RepID=A0A653BHQ3_CALMS|nr:unnamed protein product [Callosobruchus maculatus]VEN52676.1 unnamed protein product [Callosobruchus maculatus]